MELYFIGTSNEILIDRNLSTTTITLPKGVNPAEVEYILSSDTLRSVIEQLLEGDERYGRR